MGKGDHFFERRADFIADNGKSKTGRVISTAYYDGASLAKVVCATEGDCMSDDTAIFVERATPTSFSS